MKFKVIKANGGYNVNIPAGMNGDDVEILCLAVASYGFLMPWNSAATGPQLAQMINATYDDDRSKLIADTLRRN